MDARLEAGQPGRNPVGTGWVAHAQEVKSSLAAKSHPEAMQRVGFGLSSYDRFFKRCIDVVIAGVVLMAFAPLLVAVALAVRRDSPGPIIFRQTRVGRYGRPFVVYKFRTMAWDPTTTLRLFLGPDGLWRHKIADDPRVTRLGRFLRRTSIDELPQLINVLRGEMSLVGPRPELPEIVANYESWQHRRHAVRPGLTGWWQIQGRSDQPMHEHTELDLQYVENLSPRLDAVILARSVRIVSRGLGAF